MVPTCDEMDADFGPYLTTVLTYITDFQTMRLDVAINDLDTAITELRGIQYGLPNGENDRGEFEPGVTKDDIFVLVSKPGKVMKQKRHDSNSE